MAGFDERLTKILDEYASFLREKEFAIPKHQPYLVRWVKGDFQPPQFSATAPMSPCLRPRGTIARGPQAATLGCR